jgi:hypothetical protein
MKLGFDDMAASLSQHLYWFGLLLLLWHGVPVCVAGAETGVPGSSEPFQISAERNMSAPQSAGRPAETEAPSKPTFDSLVLTGTMSYEKGRFAFFDGSNPYLRRVLKVGETIGSCVLTEIAFEQVKLKAGELELELPVGRCLLREKAGQWKLGAKADDLSPAVDTAPRRIVQSPDPKRSGMVAKEGKAFEADPDEYTKWVVKKISKYYGEMDPEIKKEKHGSKIADAFSEDAPNKPEKRRKHNGG